MVDALSGFQREVLESFFRRTQAFHLTGGGALAGFHLGHRTTQDLDLFTTSPGELEDGERVLQAAADELGAVLEQLKSYPDFRRRLLRRGEDSVIVDLVYERAGGQLPKESRGAVRLDSAREILANKLCTLLSRAEIRDLVDVQALERSGLTVEDALPIAGQKDGGTTAGQLAWVLSQIRIGEDARIPGKRSAAELRGYLEDLIRRLARLAAPPS